MQTADFGLLFFRRRLTSYFAIQTSITSVHGRRCMRIARRA